MVHINHFESPFTYGSKVKPDHIDFLSNIDKLDALVVLTNDQKKDIEKQFGEHGNIFIIPNSMPYTDLPDMKKIIKRSACLYDTINKRLLMRRLKHL